MGKWSPVSKSGSKWVHLNQEGSSGHLNDDWIMKKKNTKSTNPILHPNKGMIKGRAVVTNERAALPCGSGVSWQHLFFHQILVSFLNHLSSFLIFDTWFIFISPLTFPSSPIKHNFVDVFLEFYLRWPIRHCN